MSEIIGYPKWVRGLDLVTGFIGVIIGFWIVIDISLATLTVLFLFSIVLLLIGITRIVKVATTPDEEIRPITRVFNALAGVAAIIAAAYVFLFPLVAVLISIGVLAIALVISGAARLTMGATEKDLPGWARALLIIVGLLTLILSLLAIAFPGFGFLVLTLFISVVIIISGFTRVISGFTGRY